MTDRAETGESGRTWELETLPVSLAHTDKVIGVEGMYINFGWISGRAAFEVGAAADRLAGPVREIHGSVGTKRRTRSPVKSNCTTGLIGKPTRRSMSLNTPIPAGLAGASFVALGLLAYGGYALLT